MGKGTVRLPGVAGRWGMEGARSFANWREDSTFGGCG